MKTGAFLCAGLGGILAGCSPAPVEEKQPGEPFTLDISSEQHNEIQRSYIEMLVVRFEADGCENAIPAGSVKRTGPDGKTLTRAYGASQSCLESLKDGLANIGFKETEPLTYTYQNSDGATETVTITPPTAEMRGEIEWEEFNP